MVKNVIINKKINMQSHIDKAYKTIEEYLPANYIERVMLKIPVGISVSKGTIRNIKNRSQEPDSKIEVLNALVEVALENKKAIEILTETNH